MQTEVRRHAEYAALRATIRERGTARMLLIPFVFTAWAGVAIATSAVIAVALSTLVPLLVLAAGFEATFALYTNVERIGRYYNDLNPASSRASTATPYFSTSSPPPAKMSAKAWEHWVSARAICTTAKWSDRIG